MGKRKAPPATPKTTTAPPPPSALQGEAALAVDGRSFKLVLDMEAVDRFETMTGTSLIDLLAKIRHPALMGSPKLGHLVDLTLVATLLHHGENGADDAPDRATVMRWVTGEAGWRPAINQAIARAFPTEGGAAARGVTDDAGDDDGPAWTVARLLSQWIEAGQPIAAFWRATPRIVLIAVHAYFDRRAWSAWATGQTARGAIADISDLLPKPPESDDARESRIERAATQWNLRFEAMAAEDADQAAGSEE